MHRMVDLKIEKDSLHLIKFMRGLYGLFCFSDVISAIRLKTVLLIGAKPPLVENMSGEKQPCSTSRIRTSYFLFFKPCFFRKMAPKSPQIFVTFSDTY